MLSSVFFLFIAYPIEKAGGRRRRRRKLRPPYRKKVNREGKPGTMEKTRLPYRRGEKQKEEMSLKQVQISAVQVHEFAEFFFIKMQLVGDSLV